VLALHPGLALTELRATGGGARDEAWNAIKAEVLDLPLLAVQRGGGAPMGAALVAAAAAGAISDLAAAARSWVRLGPAVRPTGHNRDLYRARARRYAQLLEALAGLSAEAAQSSPHTA
jgi:xylulokinase